MNQAHFSFQAIGEQTLRHGAFQRDLETKFQADLKLCLSYYINI